MRRKRSCEVCGGTAGAHGIDFGTRLVVLCAEHARRAEQAGAATPEALRALFIEEQGRRALIGRRAPGERRLFPPRPEGRRSTTGRRSTDAARGAGARHAERSQDPSR